MPAVEEMIDRKTWSIHDWRGVTASASFIENEILKTGATMSHDDRLWIVDAFKDRPNRVRHVIPDESVQFLFAFYELPDSIYQQVIASLQQEEQIQLPIRRQTKGQYRRKPKSI